jgi:hypothetical protein
MQFKKTGNEDSSVGIATGYGVADQFRLITKEPNREILENQGSSYEAVKALITEISLIKCSVIIIRQNFTILPTYVLYEMPILPAI